MVDNGCAREGTGSGAVFFCVCGKSTESKAALHQARIFRMCPYG